jgi:tRNA (cytidine32/guanosine34-2'-O)-methyltransferase
MTEVFDIRRNPDGEEACHRTPEEEKLVPFIACGDFSGYDADRNYPLDEDHQYLQPLVKPLTAPYIDALRERNK